jgi:hypothetical protein
MRYPVCISVNCDGSFWANHRTNGTARAAFFDQFGGMIPACSDAFDGQGYHMLGTGGSAQFTALAIGLIDNNPSFWGHSASSYLD